jgi:hypothetical protein
MGLQLSGSVQLEGNLLVTGSANSVFENISVTNRITANEINVQFVSSSIIYSSGSNKFGDEIADIHQFTGSLFVSGTLAMGTDNTGYGRISFNESSNTLRIQSSKNGTDCTPIEFWSQRDGGAFAQSMIISGSNTGLGGHIPNASYGPLQVKTPSSAYSIDIIGRTAGVNSESQVSFWNAAQSTVLASVGNIGGNLRIDADNVGVSVTPSAWWTNSTAIQLPQFASLSHQNNGSLNLMSFALETSADTFTYADTGVFPLRYNQNPNNGTHTWFTAPVGTVGGTINFTSSMSLTTAGNLGVGRTPSSGYRVDIQGNGGFRILDNDALRSILLFPPTSGTAAIVESTSANGLNLNASNASGNISLLIGGSQAVKITSGRRMLLATDTDTGAVINVSGSYMGYPVSIEAQPGGGQLALTRGGAVGEFYMGGTTGGTTELYVRSGGSVGVRLDAGAGTWANVSDIRLKDIEKPIENAVQSLQGLQTIYYSWKASQDKKLYLGLIAQEVEAVFPEIVSESSIDGMKGVKYTELIPVLIKAIQEQQTQIEELKSRVDQLENN